MRTSDGKCRIAAIQLGEAALNFIRPDDVPIKIKVALLNEEGSPCGYFTKQNGWSDETLEALKALCEALEQDAIGHIFEGSSAPVEAEKEDGPPQF